LRFGDNDPRWIETIICYMKYFQDDQGRKVPYVAPSRVGRTVTPLKNGATVAFSMS